LRDFAFECIDNAKDKIRYGRYREAVNFYAARYGAQQGALDARTIRYIITT